MDIAYCWRRRSELAHSTDLSNFLRLTGIDVALLGNNTSLSHLTLIRRLVFAALRLLSSLAKHFAVQTRQILLLNLLTDACGHLFGLGKRSRRVKRSVLTTQMLLNCLVVV